MIPTIIAWSLVGAFTLVSVCAIWYGAIWLSWMLIERGLKMLNVFGAFNLWIREGGYMAAWHRRNDKKGIP